MNEVNSTPNDLPNHDQDLPSFSPDGVDLTLIRWMLSLTPAERLETLEQAVESIQELRNAKIKS